MEKPPNKEQRPKQKSPEEKEKDALRARLNSIVGQSITTINIDTFADSALNELISFTEEIIGRYKTEHPEDISVGKELENKAFSVYGLEDLNLYLERIQEKSNQIRRIDKDLQNKQAYLIPEVITPPDAGGLQEGDSGSFEEKELIPRLKLLFYILNNDFNVLIEDVRLTRGIVTNRMMRRESYVTAEIDILNRVVQICEEENNASYVFDTAVMKRAKISVSDLNGAGKEAKNDLIDEVEGIGARLIQKPHWRDVMTELLSSSIKKKEKKVVDLSLPQVITSEFDPWRRFLESDGVYFGTFTRISQHFGLPEEMVKRYIKRHPELVVKKALSATNLEIDVYPLEEIRVAFAEYLSIPRVDIMGEWRGFSKEGESHLGSNGAISNRLGRDKRVVRRYIKNHPNLPSKKMRSAGGNVVDVYPLEQIEAAFEYLSSLPQVAMGGEWRGFLESDGAHWGAVVSIWKRTGITYFILREYVRNHPELPFKEIRDVTGKKIKAYSLEQIEGVFKTKSRT